jgi:hypothetical protein
MSAQKHELSDCSDEALLNLLAQRNKEALAAIYERYAPKIYTYIITFVLNYKDHEQAQKDAAHMLIKVFISFWDSAQKPMPSKTLNDHLFFHADCNIYKYTYPGKPPGHNFRFK